jgi:hypothetical protein
MDVQDPMIRAGAVPGAPGARRGPRGRRKSAKNPGPDLSCCPPPAGGLGAPAWGGEREPTNRSRALWGRATQPLHPLQLVALRDGHSEACVRCQAMTQRDSEVV